MTIFKNQDIILLSKQYVLRTLQYHAESFFTKRGEDVESIGKIIGKIDKEIYKCITEDIITDEVIITNNQIEHIKIRHNESLDLAMSTVEETLLDPDFIFRDKHPNTGLIVKLLEVDNLHLQVVLRICTSNDTKGYKNSIISCWVISKSRLANYLRNKEILYRKS